MHNFGKDGIYLDSDENPKCRCNHKHINDWDQYKYERHFVTKGHKKYIAMAEMEGVHQSALDELTELEVAKEDKRLTIARTRSTPSAEVDRPFQERFVAMCLSVGTPLHRADKMRPWVESECRRSLTSSSHPWSIHPNPSQERG